MNLRRAAIYGLQIAGAMLVVAALVVFLFVSNSSATLGIPLARLWIAARMARQRFFIGIDRLFSADTTSSPFMQSFGQLRRGKISRAYRDYYGRKQHTRRSSRSLAVQSFSSETIILPLTSWQQADCVLSDDHWPSFFDTGG
jgi:hypothetical protein